MSTNKLNKLNKRFENQNMNNLTRGKTEKNVSIGVLHENL